MTPLTVRSVKFTSAKGGNTTLPMLSSSLSRRAGTIRSMMASTGVVLSELCLHTRRSLCGSLMAYEDGRISTYHVVPGPASPIVKPRRTSAPPRPSSPHRLGRRSSSGANPARVRSMALRVRPAAARAAAASRCLHALRQQVGARHIVSTMRLRTPPGSRSSPSRIARATSSGAPRTTWMNSSRLMGAITACGGDLYSVTDLADHVPVEHPVPVQARAGGNARPGW